MAKEIDSSCLICGACHNLTFHHLIPRSCHRNNWFRKRFDVDDMRNRGATLCRHCHSYIHKQFDEKKLGREMNTSEALLARPELVKFGKWAKKHRY